MCRAERGRTLIASTRPNRCKHCKLRMPDDKAHHVIHNDCIEPWQALRDAKKVRAAAKKKLADAKVERAATKAALQKHKTLAKWAAEAQIQVNNFIRLRDAALPCISCGRHHQGQYHAGHFKSVGAHPELRFVEINISKQCQPCNTHLGGNVLLYRQALIIKIGAEAVDWLEGPHPTRRYTQAELIEIKTTYAAKARALKAQA